MNQEPDFISQTAEPMSSQERKEWAELQGREAIAKGATWHRWSQHPNDKNLLLYEGWKVRPEDEGEPRFQLVRID